MSIKREVIRSERTENWIFIEVDGYTVLQVHSNGYWTEGQDTRGDINEIICDALDNALHTQVSGLGVKL